MAPEFVVAIVGALGAILAACIATLPAWFTFSLQRRQAQTHVQGVDEIGTLGGTVKARTRQFYLLIGVVVVFVILVVGLTLTYGRAVAERFAAHREAAAMWPKLVREAERRKLPYIMTHVTLLAAIERSQPSQSQRVRARVMYSILPLKDFDAKANVFTEKYTFAKPENQEHWYGSEEELLSSSTDYQVHFLGVTGRPATVVTGVNAAWNMSVEQLGRELGATLPLPADAQVISYTNKEDFIGQLLIIVESPDSPIAALPKGAIRRETTGVVTLSDAFSGAPAGAPFSQRSVVARWNNVSPGETVAVAVRTTL